MTAPIQSSKSPETEEPAKLTPFAKKWDQFNGFSPEVWKKAQAEQDAEEKANASPTPVVFPVHF